MSQGSIQLSQISNISDLLSDVDTLIQENGLHEEMSYILKNNEVKNENVSTHSFADTTTEDMKFPPALLSTNEDAEYAGPFNFEIIIEKNPENKKAAWEYSTKLNKIFVPLNLKFPISFKLDIWPEKISFFIRATPYFCQSQHFQDLVKRCVTHQLPEDPSNLGVDKHVYQHILRCGNKDTRYFGNAESNQRLSVVFPLQKFQSGGECVKEFFSFVCKNSCPGGLNRRPFNVFFTLEDENGQIYGRKIVGVRVCACTKRDKEKEENDVEEFQVKKKRKLVHVKQEDKIDRDTNIFPLRINIGGKENYIRILEVIRDQSFFCMQKLSKGEQNPHKSTYNTVCKMLDDVSKFD